MSHTIWIEVRGFGEKDTTGLPLSLSRHRRFAIRTKRMDVGRMMRPFLRLPVTLCAILLACSLLGSRVQTYAQAPEGPDTSESTTEDSTGLVTAISPYSTITVEDRKGPFTYRLGLDLHVTGPDNRPLKITEIRAGDEVTVFYYYRDGHPTVSRLVVLRRGAIGGK